MFNFNQFTIMKKASLKNHLEKGFYITWVTYYIDEQKWVFETNDKKYWYSKSFPKYIKKYQIIQKYRDSDEALLCNFQDEL